jgi:hypothetical protein
MGLDLHSLRRVQAEHLAPLAAASKDDLQVSGVAVTVPHGAACTAVVRVVVGLGALVGFLGALPGGPGFALYAVDLLQFDFASQVEVADRGLTPLGLDLLQVNADGRLLDSDALGDRGLGQTLDVQVGDLFSAAIDRDAAGAADGHLCWATYIAHISELGAS